MMLSENNILKYIDANSDSSVNILALLDEFDLNMDADFRILQNWINDKSLTSSSHDLSSLLYKIQTIFSGTTFRLSNIKKEDIINHRI